MYIPFVVISATNFVCFFETYNCYDENLIKRSYTDCMILNMFDL